MATRGEVGGATPNAVTATLHTTDYDDYTPPTGRHPCRRGPRPPTRRPCGGSPRTPTTVRPPYLSRPTRPHCATVNRPGLGPDVSPVDLCPNLSVVQLSNQTLNGTDGPSTLRVSPREELVSVGERLQRGLSGPEKCLPLCPVLWDFYVRIEGFGFPSPPGRCRVLWGKESTSILSKRFQRYLYPCKGQDTSGN